MTFSIVARDPETGDLGITIAKGDGAPAAGTLIASPAALPASDAATPSGRS